MYNKCNDNKDTPYASNVEERRMDAKDTETGKDLMGAWLLSAYVMGGELLACSRRR